MSDFKFDLGDTIQDTINGSHKGIVRGRNPLGELYIIHWESDRGTQQQSKTHIESYYELTPNQQGISKMSKYNIDDVICFAGDHNAKVKIVKVGMYNYDVKKPVSVLTNDFP